MSGPEAPAVCICFYGWTFDWRGLFHQVLSQFVEFVSHRSVEALVVDSDNEAADYFGGLFLLFSLFCIDICYYICYIIIEPREGEWIWEENDMAKEANIQVRVTDQFKTLVRSAAAREQKTISEYLLDLIKKDLAKKGIIWSPFCIIILLYAPDRQLLHLTDQLFCRPIAP